MDRSRIALFDRAGNPIGELSKEAGTLLSRNRVEEINGEHSLTITTAEHLEVGVRAVTMDSTGRIHEWVLDEPDELHDSGEHAIGTYHFSWSLQSDLKGVCGELRQPGMASPVTSRYAVAAALDGTKRWKVGTCSTAVENGAVMFQDNAWDRLTTVVRRWGGEIGVIISIGPKGVTERKVNLSDHLGSKDAIRRFEWGHNLTSIRRTPDPGPYYCRVIPLGSGETEYADDDITTFEWKIGIEEVNNGVPYLRDTESEMTFRLADGEGGWEYPTCIVSYSTDDEEELLALAKEDYLSHTRPKVSYEGTVAQFAAAGMDVEGIELGDEVQVVDYGFNPDAPLLLQERVIRMEVDEFGGEDIRLTIGRLTPSIERSIASIANAVGLDQISINTPAFDQSKYQVTTPTLPTYIISTPDAGSYVAPSYDSYSPSIDAAISAIGSRVGAIEAAIGSGAAAGITDDGWIHKVNGVTKKTGTVDFVSAGGSATDPSGYITDSSSAWGTSGKRETATINWGTTTGGGHN